MLAGTVTSLGTDQPSHDVRRRRTCRHHHHLQCYPNSDDADTATSWSGAHPCLASVQRRQVRRGEELEGKDKESEVVCARGVAGVTIHRVARAS